MTGQYPSLHGVSQTNGIAKQASDSDMFWLDRNTVPTMGDYLREAGYETYYKGKWHVSYEDIIVPGTHEGLSSFDPVTGVPDGKQGLYDRADRLENFGFSGWIGPEPHGKNPRNSGSSAAIGLSGRDEVYAEEVVELIEALDRRHNESDKSSPWLLVASFVNPHDIVLYGALTAQLPVFRFHVDPMPEVSPPPTLDENLLTKPRCQASYRDIYPKALQPIVDEPFYRKLYYQLQKNADRQMYKVFQALTRSSFYENTIVIFTSDHGDLLGSHGRLRQKFYCAYEEMLHVPFVIHNPKLYSRHEHFHSLTSHVDVLPTLLGLARADTPEIRRRLQSRFSEARPLVGRNLAPFLGESSLPAAAEEPIYFMTDDDVTRGQHQVNPLGEPYPSVIQPNHIETVIAPLYRNGKKELWKFSRYFDNPQFWSIPGVKDETGRPIADRANGQNICWATQVKTTPDFDEYELYDLTDDPLETCNLAHPAYATPYTASVQAWMMQLMEQQRSEKRLTPARQGMI
ncbi:sulfatase-like hydrolase/transferase [Paenibacillus hodogayensis]